MSKDDSGTPTLHLVTPPGSQLILQTFPDGRQVFAYTTQTNPVSVTATHPNMTSSSDGQNVRMTTTVTSSVKTIASVMSVTTKPSSSKHSHPPVAYKSTSVIQSSTPQKAFASKSAFVKPSNGNIFNFNASQCVAKSLVKQPLASTVASQATLQAVANANKPIRPRPKMLVSPHTTPSSNIASKTVTTSAPARVPKVVKKPAAMIPTTTTVYARATENPPPAIKQEMPEPNESQEVLDLSTKPSPKSEASTTIRIPRCLPQIAPRPLIFQPNTRAPLAQYSAGPRQAVVRPILPTRPIASRIVAPELQYPKLPVVSTVMTCTAITITSTAVNPSRTNDNSASSSTPTPSAAPASTAASDEENSAVMSCDGDANDSTTGGESNNSVSNPVTELTAKPRTLRHYINGIWIEEEIDMEALDIENQKTQAQAQEVVHRSTIQRRRKKSRSKPRYVTSSEESEEVDEEDDDDEDGDMCICEYCGLQGNRNSFYGPMKRFCKQLCAKQYRQNCSRGTGVPRAVHSSSPVRKKKKFRSRTDSFYIDTTPKVRTASQRHSSDSRISPHTGPLLRSDFKRSTESAMSPGASVRDSAKVSNYLLQPVTSSAVFRTEDIPSATSAPEAPNKPIKEWTRNDVYNFIRSIPAGSEYAQSFLSQDIDGHALLLLKEDHLMQAMSMKLGPALKICSHVRKLKES